MNYIKVCFFKSKCNVVWVQHHILLAIGIQSQGNILQSIRNSIKICGLCIIHSLISSVNSVL